MILFGGRLPKPRASDTITYKEEENAGTLE